MTPPADAALTTLMQKKGSGASDSTTKTLRLISEGRPDLLFLDELSEERRSWSTARGR
jgi:hypothetical protein